MADFTAGQVLTAAQLDTAFNTFTINPQTGTTYTLGAADAGELVTVNNNSGGTVTIPANATTAFATGTHVGVMNVGTAGTFTIAGAGGVTLNADVTTIAPKAAISLIKTATNTWYAVAGGAVPKASVSSTTGSPTTGANGGATYYKFTGDGTITFSKAGLVDVLIVGGGAGGLRSAGGAGGLVYITSLYVPASSVTVTVGSGGATYAYNNQSWGGKGGDSRFGSVTAVGGGGGGSAAGQGAYMFNQLGGSSGGATDGVSVYFPGILGQGNTGALGSPTGGGGGGGGAGGAASGGTGGAASSNSITGAAVNYAKGGTYGGTTTGAANTGNGGDGTSGTGNGYAGGSGVVVVLVGTV